MTYVLPQKSTLSGVSSEAKAASHQQPRRPFQSLNVNTTPRTDLYRVMWKVSPPGSLYLASVVGLLGVYTK
jgi:hypothetical protein